MPVVLRAVGLHALEVRVIGSRYGYMVADGVTADDEAAGMDTGASHRSLEHLGILDGVGQLRVGGSLGIAQLGHILDGVCQVHLRTLRQTVGNGLAEGI